MRFLFSIICILQLLGLSNSADCTLHDLQHYEHRVFSQNGEDGILLEILRNIGITNKKYVEFGVQDGFECNSRILRETMGFSGVMFDGGYSNPQIGLHQEYITMSNIIQLFEKYNVPKIFDMLTIDTDMFDWWILSRILIDGI